MMMRTRAGVWGVCAVSLFFAASDRLSAATPGPEAATKSLHDLFDREWKWRLKESPEFATGVGVHEYDDKLSDLAPATLERETVETKAFLRDLAAIDRSALSGDEQVNYDIFQTQLQQRVDSFGFGEQFLTINADSGFHSDSLWSGSRCPSRR